VHYAGESSRTTHGAAECVEACRLMASMLCRAFDGALKDSVLLETSDNSAYACEKIAAIARGEYRDKPVNAIRGSGYVVESLEAALWCFDRTESFEAAILQAANLGDDADTTAAICGQIAGAVFGASLIPERWLSKLAMRSFIDDLAVRLYRADDVNLRDRYQM
jgi:ADP-ribosyl-[dinitrogen reductase] hydrolase